MEEKNKGADAFSAALDGILSNPEMMSMISSMAQKLKEGSPTASEASETQEVSAASAPEGPLPTSLPAMGDLGNAIGALAPLLSGGLPGGSAPDDERARLLKALKPYLSKKRRDAIDHIISLSRLSVLFKKHS